MMLRVVTNLNFGNLIIILTNETQSTVLTPTLTSAGDHYTVAFYLCWLSAEKHHWID